MKTYHCTHSGYIDETKRLYGVLNIRLTGRDWLAGPGRGKFSIADINVLPWVNVYSYAGVESLDEFPNVKVRLRYAFRGVKFIETCFLARPGWSVRRSNLGLRPVLPCKPNKLKGVEHLYNTFDSVQSRL